jgi:diguanylate cyclase (GGDEF)-like protein/PAS domain S-box-containing protein
MQTNPFTNEMFLDCLFEGVFLVDTDRRITYWNKGAERITGFKREEVIGSACLENLLRHVDLDGNELCLEEFISNTISDAEPREAKVFLYHKFGHRVSVSVRTTPLMNENGVIVGAVEVFNDNSNAQKMLEEFEKLRNEAYHDHLTNVGNRRYAELTINSRIYEFNNRSIPFAMIFIDIDHFKNINDNYGHNTGDEVLVMVARTISNALRSMDVVSRWGGEEFIVILPGASLTTLRSVADRIIKLVEQSFLLIDGARVGVTVSAGATIAKKDDTSTSMVARADGLMYESKRRGRNIVTVE